MTRTRPLDVLADRTVTELKVWLFEVMQNEEAGEVELQPEKSAIVQVQNLFDQLGSAPRLQEKMRQAVVAALTEWRLKSHGWETLGHLAQTAIFLRASASVPILGDVVQRARLLQPGSPEAFEAADVVVGVLSGFAPGEPVQLILEGFFFDPALDPRLAGHLFQGLCVCCRQDYPRYLSRYRELARRNPGYFEESFAMGQFIETVTPPVIEKYWPQVAREDRVYLLSSLDRAWPSQVELLLSGAGPHLRWTRYDLSTLLPLAGQGHFGASEYWDLYSMKSKQLAKRAEDLDINEFLGSLLPADTEAGQRAVVKG